MLHPSDRFMVKLIQIDRLGPRLEAMLYRIKFDESRSLIEEGATKLIKAGQDLLQASNFKELLSVCNIYSFIASPLTIRKQLILLIGNYMNGTGVKGGAFGFRVSSINKVRLSQAGGRALLTLFVAGGH